MKDLRMLQSVLMRFPDSGQRYGSVVGMGEDVVRVRDYYVIREFFWRSEVWVTEDGVRLIPDGTD